MQEMEDEEDIVYQQRKEELKKLWIDYLLKKNSISSELWMKLCKKEDNKTLKFKQKPEYYYDLIYNATGVDCLKNFSVELEICTNGNQRDLWNFYRHSISSLRKSHHVGRNNRILVKESITKKYIGILSISSDILCLGDRDKYIGWSKEVMQDLPKRRINNIFNITCCVPVGNFGFNFNGGKLLASLAFSKEIVDHLEKKYNNRVAGILTTSLYGKSIMYDRLPTLKFIGYTKGYGSTQVPDELYKKNVEFLKDYDGYINAPTLVRSCTRFFKMIRVLRMLGLDDNYLKHDDYRGIYFGYTGSKAKQFLCGETDAFEYDKIKPCKEIVNWWVDRWAKQRFIHLQSENNIKTHLDVLGEIRRAILTETERNRMSVQLFRERKKKLEGIEKFKKINAENMREYRKKKKTPIEQPIVEITHAVHPEAYKTKIEKIPNAIKKKLSNEHKENIKQSLIGKTKGKIKKKIITSEQYDEILQLKDTGKKATEVASMFISSKGLELDSRYVREIWSGKRIV